MEVIQKELQAWVYVRLRGVTRTETVNREEAIAELRSLLRPGSTVYTEIAYVETRGRPRDTHIKLYVFKDNEPRSITGMAGRAVGSRMNKSGDAIISVKFLRDAEFAVVAALSATLFRNGFECIGKGCPSHEHPTRDSNYAPHWHKDGRNALKALGLKYRTDT
jgi:hypothetical protein